MAHHERGVLCEKEPLKGSESLDLLGGGGLCHRPAAVARGGGDDGFIPGLTLVPEVYLSLGDEATVRSSGFDSVAFGTTLVITSGIDVVLGSEIGSRFTRTQRCGSFGIAAIGGVGRFCFIASTFSRHDVRRWDSTRPKCTGSHVARADLGGRIPRATTATLVEAVAAKRLAVALAVRPPARTAEHKGTVWVFV